ncbi:MAG: hypothetical protein NTZ65_05000 [Candidatus Berkelbacteria bacterium]|nr:hypothetical protein [Candidatus Berkelbacteria bacterium]
MTNCLIAQLLFLTFCYFRVSFRARSLTEKNTRGATHMFRVIVVITLIVVSLSLASAEMQRTSYNSSCISADFPYSRLEGARIVGGVALARTSIAIHPVIQWKELRGGCFKDRATPAAAQITLASSDPSVLLVDGSVVRPLKPGKAWLFVLVSLVSCWNGETIELSWSDAYRVEIR